MRSRFSGILRSEGVVISEFKALAYTINATFKAVHDS